MQFAPGCAGAAPARAVVGLAAAAVRLALRQELQGEEAGGAADHAAAGQGAPQRAQLRRAGQAAPRDGQAARARRGRRAHRHAAAGRPPAAALRLQPQQRRPLSPAHSNQDVCSTPRPAARRAIHSNSRNNPPTTSTTSTF